MLHCAKQYGFEREVISSALILLPFKPGATFSTFKSGVEAVRGEFVRMFLSLGSQEDIRSHQAKVFSFWIFIFLFFFN